MNLELEKRQIIEEIKGVHDEWVLKAIKRLLGVYDEDYIDDAHKVVLDERISAYESGQSEMIEWEEAQKRLMSKK